MKPTLEPKPIVFGPSFNWLAVLKDLAAGMPISDRDYAILFGLATQWPTCACSQLCQSLPRDPTGVPLDDQLSDLGIEFYWKVGRQKWRQALATFHKIEQRTEELLEEQNAPR